MNDKDKTYEEAEGLVKDPDKLEKMLQKLEKKMEAIPKAGNALAYVPLMVSLVRSYIKKEYNEVPVASIVAIVAALLYVLSPADIIPDFLPAGYVDDAVIVAGCLVLVRTDLEDYRAWRKDAGKEFEDLPDYKEINEVAKENHKYLSGFFKGKKDK